MSETDSEEHAAIPGVYVPSPAPATPSLSQPATVDESQRAKKRQNNMTWAVEQFTAVGDKVKCKHCGAELSVVKERPGTAQQSHMTKVHGNKTRLNTYVSPPVKKRGAERASADSNKVPKATKERTMLKGAELATFLEHWAQRALPFRLVEDHVIVPAKEVTDSDGKVLNLNRKLLKRLIVEHGEALVKKKLEQSHGQYCSIALDLGTMQSKRTMDVVVHTEGQEFLYSVEAVGKGEGTAPSLYKKLLPILHALKEAGLTVVAVVTDNASNLTAMERLFKDDFPEIVFVNCAIHSVQLLVTDCVYMHPTVEPVWKIIDDVRAKANKLGLVKVPKLAPTRWNYAVRVLEHLVKNFDKYNAGKCMTSGELTVVETALDFLLPYQVITKYLERTKANILDIAVALRAIDAHTSSSGVDVRSAYLHRVMLHFSSDAHILAAVFSNPFEDWSRVDEATKRYITAALHRLCVKWGLNPDNATAQLNAFFEGAPQARSRRGMDTSAKPQALYSRFWSMQAGHLAELYKVYRRLLAVTASEAACERAFSRQKLSHTDVRNRLETDSICALLRCATIKVDEEVPEDDTNDKNVARRLEMTVPTVTELSPFLKTLVYCAKFAAGQELHVGSVIWMHLDEGRGALREYKAVITRMGEPFQHFFAKKLPERFDEDGNEVMPRDRFMYVDRFQIQYEGSKGEFHELLVSSLTEEADEWEPCEDHFFLSK